MSQWPIKPHVAKRIIVVAVAVAALLACALAVMLLFPGQPPHLFTITGEIKADDHAAGRTAGLRVSVLEPRVGADAVLPCLSKGLKTMWESVYYQEEAARRATEYASAAERQDLAREIASSHSMITQLQYEVNFQNSDYDVLEIVTKLSRNVIGPPPIDRILSAATVSTARTTGDGTFSVSGVPPGRYYVHAAVESAERRFEWIVPASVTDRDVKVTLDPENAIITKLPSKGNG